jgi:hypothetical protein
VVLSFESIKQLQHNLLFSENIIGYGFNGLEALFVLRMMGIVML